MPSGARFRAADFGPSIAEVGFKAGAKAFGDVAEVQSGLDQLHDEITVKEAVTAVSGRYAETAYTGPDPYFRKGGKDALLARPEFEQGLDDYIQKARTGLKNDQQRRMFDNAVTSQRQSWGVQVATHADKETKAYDIDETLGRVGMTGELAKQVYVSDPEDGENQIADGLGQIDRLAALQDWGPDRRALEKLKFTSGVYRDIGQNIISAGGPDGPALGLALVEKHGGSMTEDDRRLIANTSRITQDRFEAEQRRVDAEARRLDREDKADARDRAESAARNIDDGVPLEPDRLAAAIGDATKAGDEALAERLRQGGLKNKMTQAYAGASPVEMQDRVNELSAQIASEGDKVKPDTVVERDHLQTLLGKANTAIATDPISWGAAALKIDPGRLDLNNGASITKRIQFSTAVTRRTGRPTPPMTTEEAAVFAPVVVAGTVAQKTSLAVQLARFGPMAATAARQVAPNNAGFQNLVGLAGLSNRGVAMSRVNQIVAGQEILKTNSKLVKKDDALRDFNTFSGGALQFLPSVKAGVFDNAQAILANDANEKGVTEWGEARPRWFAAVNSALGAYTKDGKQIGGLAQFNGGMTVVPEDMAVEDFERRVSRAHGPQMRAASNGVPTFANGVEPTATDIRKLQWVPVRDGVYRVGNGFEFLRLKSGGFFEVNARKLP